MSLPLNGRAFLNSCSLYIRLAPEQFCDEQEKILWALTFFKDGHTAKWSENVFRQEADTGVFPIPTWGDFEQQFQLHFFPVNAEADAINTLEGTSYHQGARTVDDYLDNFQTLVSDAGYTDPRTLVVKFQRDLKLGIQNQIATMPYGQPADTDPDAWYRAARRIDQARLANEAFQSISRSTPSGPTKTVQSPRGRREFCVARPAISAPRSPVNKFTVLTIEDPNTIDSKLIDAPPPNPLVPAPLRKPKWEKRLPKLFAISALDA